MRSTWREYPRAVLIIGALACREDADALSAADTAALHAMDSTYVARVLTRDWPGLAALLTDDAVLMPPNAGGVVGRDANLARFQGLQFDSVAYSHFDIRVGGADDIAYLEGRYRIRMKVPNVPTAFADSGKHLWVLLRQPSGEWRIRSIIWNSDMAPASPG